MQWRYIGTSTANADFANVDNWTGIDNVFETKIAKIENSNFENDLDIVDGFGNVLARFSNGHIRVKNFNSVDVNSIIEYIGINNIPEFDITQNYSTDDVVKYKNFVYIFITEHSAGGWNPAQVELYNIGNQINIKSTSYDVDLNITDENDNILVQFKNGNIKVKNFDSSDISKFILSEKLKNKKFALIGDSISTFSGWLPSDITGYDGTTYSTYYPKGDVNVVNNTWWYKMCEYLNINPTTQFNNCAWSGSRVTGDSTSTSSASAACSDRRITDLSARGFTPDIIICWITANDWGHAVDLGNWQVTDAIPAEGTISQARSAYALMLNKLHTTYPYARIFCCTILDDFKRDQGAGWPSNNANGVSTYQWNQNIIEIANAFGCDIIDLHNCGINYSNIEQYYSVDEGLHPNAAGQTLIAKKVIAELNAKY